MKLPFLHFPFLQNLEMLSLSRSALIAQRTLAARCFSAAAADKYWVRVLVLSN